MEGPCEMAWQAWAGSQRHYCGNAAKCEVALNGHVWPCCWVCLAELVELGVEHTVLDD